ncbi:MAG: SurA N-terminal domain-containing protein [Deltaproteobacteria bacterium]|nr:SurA N-terminal domain-containing protein [Deltaproteobacteria bacterium]
MKSICALIFSVIIVVSFSQYVSAETSNRVVAIVNNDVITLYELNKKMEEMTGLTPNEISSKDKKSYLDTRQKVLELLIDEKITQEKIQEMRIQVSSDQVDNTIENIKKTNHVTHEELVAGLKRQGITYEKYRDIIKKDLERNRLIHYEVKSKIIIREKRILQYYQRHKEEYCTEAKVHLAGIFLNNKSDNEKGLRELSKKGEDILTRLRKGEDFGKLAREFSEGPGADEGGDLGRFETDQLDPVLRKALKGIPEGGVSSPIIRGNGIQIIKLVNREVYRVRPFEEVRDAINEILYKEEVEKRYTAWIKNLRENTYTKILF